MPRQQHDYGLNHLHLTASTYHRARLFDSDRFRSHFAQTLDQLRRQQNFRLLGWVLMPGRVAQTRAVSSLRSRAAGRF